MGNTDLLGCTVSLLFGEWMPSSGMVACAVSASINRRNPGGQIGLVSTRLTRRVSRVLSCNLKHSCDLSAQLFINSQNILNGTFNDLYP
jgi:hypothetical protein